MTVKTTMAGAAFAALALLIPAACDNDPSGLIDALTITNETDRYEFELDNPGTYSGTTRHEWEFTGSIAEVVIETPITGGSGSVTIQDADNGQVLVQSFLTTGTFESNEGRAGSWTVTTILTNATGHLKYTITRK